MEYSIVSQNVHQVSSPSAPGPSQPAPKVPRKLVLLDLAHTNKILNWPAARQ